MHRAEFGSAVSPIMTIFCPNLRKNSSYNFRRYKKYWKKQKIWEVNRLNALFGACRDLLCNSLLDEECVIRTCVPALVAEAKAEAYISETNRYQIHKGYGRGKRLSTSAESSALSYQKRNKSPLQNLMTMRNRDLYNDLYEEAMSHPESSHLDSIGGYHGIVESRKFIHPVIFSMLNDLERIEKSMVDSTEVNKEMGNDVDYSVKESVNMAQGKRMGDMARFLTLWKLKRSRKDSDKRDVPSDSNVTSGPVKRRVTASVGSLKCIENLCGNKRGAMRQLCKIQLC